MATDFGKTRDVTTYTTKSEKLWKRYEILLEFSIKSIILKKTLNHFQTILRLVLSFRNLHLFHSNATETQATFWSEVHFKPMTNLELSNALAHDAELVLSFITKSGKCRNPKDPSRSLITSRAPLLINNWFIRQRAFIEI